MNIRSYVFFISILFWFGCEENKIDCESISLDSMEAQSEYQANPSEQESCIEYKDKYKEGIDGECSGFTQNVYDAIPCESSDSNENNTLTGTWTTVSYGEGSEISSISLMEQACPMFNFTLDSQGSGEPISCFMEADSSLIITWEISEDPNYDYVLLIPEGGEDAGSNMIMWVSITETGLIGYINGTGEDEDGDGIDDLKWYVFGMILGDADCSECEDDSGEGNFNSDFLPDCMTDCVDDLFDIIDPDIMDNTEMDPNAACEMITEVDLSCTDDCSSNDIDLTSINLIISGCELCLMLGDCSIFFEEVQGDGEDENSDGPPECIMDCEGIEIAENLEEDPYGFCNWITEIDSSCHSDCNFEETFMLTIFDNICMDCLENNNCETINFDDEGDGDENIDEPPECMMDCEGIEILEFPEEDPYGFCNWVTEVDSSCHSDCSDEETMMLTIFDDICEDCLEDNNCETIFNNHGNGDESSDLPECMGDCFETIFYSMDPSGDGNVNANAACEMVTDPDFLSCSDDCSENEIEDSDINEIITLCELCLMMGDCSLVFGED